MKTTNLCRLVLVITMGMLGAIFGPPGVHAQELTVHSYEVVTATRVSRTVFEYELRAKVTSGLGYEVTGVSGEVQSSGGGTTVVEGALTFGTLSAGGTATSSDTFRVRQDRTAAFNPATLNWSLNWVSPAPTIQIASPADNSTTTAASVLVSGSFTQPATGVAVNGVTATLNGNNFSATVPLAVGANTITATATGPGGQGTDSITVTREAVIEPPTVEITSPADNSATTAASVEVLGTVAGQVSSVDVNGVTATLNGNNFSATVPLVLGANTITATVTGPGGQGTDSITVTREIVIEPPTVEITSPADNSTTTAASVEVLGTVAGQVSSVDVNGVTATLNGNNFSATVPLVLGANTITATVTGPGGQGTDSITVTREQVGAPTVEITSPADNSTTTASSVEVAGTVTGQVDSVDVNGVAAVLNGNNFVATVTLNIGANSITATATGPGGQGTDTINVTREAVQGAPTIDITSPEDNSTTTAERVQVLGTFDGQVSSIVVNDLVVATRNGNNFSASVPLNVGPNIITARANGPGGQGSDSITVTREEVIAAPVVEITAPLDTATTTASSVVVTGTVEGQVNTVSVNGVAASLNGNIFTATVALNLGGNTITATAAGPGGQGVDTVSVTRLALPPTVEITAPEENLVTAALSVQVSGTVNGTVDTVSVNGVAAALNGTSFSATVPLVLGENTLTATASGPGGQASDSITVTREPVVLAIEITSPADNFLTRETSVEVQGTVGQGVVSVRVNGVNATLNGSSFSATLNLREGRNPITATASDGLEGSGVDLIAVRRDTSPPLLNIEMPSDGATLSEQEVTVTGLVNDIVDGTVNETDCHVFVNGVESRISNRSYEAQKILLSRGENTIVARAVDAAGNATTRQITVRYRDPAEQQNLRIAAGNNQSAPVGTVLAAPLVVEAIDSVGNPIANQPVIFSVIRNDGVIIKAEQRDRELLLMTDENGLASVLFQVGTRTGAGNNQVAVRSPGFNDEVVFCTSALVGQPARVSALLPETQVGGINEPLPMAWTAYVVDIGGNPVEGVDVQFQVTQGGGNFGGEATVLRRTDSNGKAQILQTLGPDVGPNAHAVEASIVGVDGASARFLATGLVTGEVEDTRVSGLVLNHANEPMANVYCEIEGTTEHTVTDDQGQFILHNVPVGPVRLLVDARDRGFEGEWHMLEFDMVTVAGANNTVDRPIYMVRLDLENSKIAGGDEDVVIQMKDIPGATLTIYKNSLHGPNGQREMRVMWTQVNMERVPMPPPLGSQFMLAWAVQPPGIHFDPPATICIPNMGMPVGQQTEVFGFDHDVAAFVAVGTATVIGDGSLMCSDAGFGVMKSGWGGCVPPPPPCTQAQNAPCPPPNTPCYKYLPIPVTGPCTCPYAAFQAKVLTAEGKVNGNDEATVCVGESVNFAGTATSEYCDGLEYQWDFGDGVTATGAGAAHTYTAGGTFTATFTAKCTGCASAQKTDTVIVKVAEVASLIPSEGTEFDDGDGDDKTKVFVVCKATAGDVTITATPNPNLVEADLPTGWTLTGGTGAGKLTRTLTKTATGETEFVAKCGTSERKLKICVVEVTFSRAPTEDAAGNAFGFDEMDTPADATDDRISVKRGGETFVKVKIDGITDFKKVFFKGADEAVAKADPVNGTAAEFLLKIQGQATDKGSTKLEARLGKDTGPACGFINVEVYKEIALSGKIFRVFKTGAEAATIGADVASADVQTTANSFLKFPVVKITVGASSKKGVAFDKNNNGRVDYYNDGTNPETKQIYDDLSAASAHYTDAVLLKDSFYDVWRISSSVAVGATKVTVTGGAGGLDTAETFSIGLPDNSDSETFKITAVNGQELTIDTDSATAGNQGFTKAHAQNADDALSHRIKSDGHNVAGLSSNIGSDQPALLIGGTAAAVGKILAHEQMHGQGLSDVNDLSNVMHYNISSAPASLPFRYKELVQVVTGTPNAKAGSPKDNQWDKPGR